MIRLNIARKLEAVLAGAVATTQPDVLVAYRDTVKSENAQFSTFTKPVTMNGASAVTICDGPVSGALREVDFVNVRNNDTASITVTIRVNDAGVTYTLRKVTLATLDQLCYSFVRGWYVVLAGGGEKVNVNSFGTSVFNGAFLRGVSTLPSSGAVGSAEALGSQWGSTGGAAITPASGGGASFYNWSGTVGSESYTEVWRATSGGDLRLFGALEVNSATLIKSNTTLSNGAAASAATLNNAPAAGNPTKWIPINDNGTVRYLPAW